jgi:hypothetical protein
MPGGPLQLAAAFPRSWLETSAPVPIEVCSTSESPIADMVTVPTMVRRA